MGKTELMDGIRVVEMVWIIGEWGFGVDHRGRWC